MTYHDGYLRTQFTVGGGGGEGGGGRVRVNYIVRLYVFVRHISTIVM